MRLVLVAFLLLLAGIPLSQASGMQNAPGASGSPNGQATSSSSNASMAQSGSASRGPVASGAVISCGNTDNSSSPPSRSSLEIWRDRCQIAAAIATILAFGVATITYVANVRRINKEREVSAFIRMNDLYRRYLERVMDDKDDALARVEMEDEKTPKADLHLLWVISMLESSFVMYHGRKDEFWDAQWDGWKTYIDRWCGHSAVRERLDVLLKGVDGNFIAEVRKKTGPVQGSQRNP